MHTERTKFIRTALRFHNVVRTRRRGSLNEICSYLNLNIKELHGLRTFLQGMGADIRYNRTGRYYEYLNQFHFEITVKEKAA